MVQRVIHFIKNFTEKTLENKIIKKVSQVVAECDIQKAWQWTEMHTLWQLLKCNTQLLAKMHPSLYLENHHWLQNDTTPSCLLLETSRESWSDQLESLGQWGFKHKRSGSAAEGWSTSMTQGNTSWPGSEYPLNSKSFWKTVL